MRRLLCLLALAALALAGVALAQHSARTPAQELAAQGRIEEATKLYRETLKRDPNDVAACSELATILCNSGQAVDGTAMAADCIRRRPRAPDLFVARGVCNQTRGPDGFADAATDYRQAIALAPGNAGAHNQLGGILQAQGNQEQAITEFQAAMDLDPTMLIAWNNKAASLIALGRQREAIALLQTAISRSDNLKGRYFYTNLGIAFMQVGMPGQAEAAFLMETAINPEHLPAHLNLGNLYVLRSRFPEAIYEYNYILSSDPKNRDALINLGAALVLSGNPAEGRQYLTQAVALYPDSPLAHHYLGQADAALGEPDKAAAEKKRALELGYRPSPAAPVAAP